MEEEGSDRGGGLGLSHTSPAQAKFVPVDAGIPGVCLASGVDSRVGAIPAQVASLDESRLETKTTVGKKARRGHWDFMV